MGQKINVSALSAALLIAFSGHLAAAEKRDSECSRGAIHCREKHHDAQDTYFAPFKKQLTELAGQPEKRHGPIPSLTGLRTIASITKNILWLWSKNEINVTGHFLNSLIAR